MVELVVDVEDVVDDVISISSSVTCGGIDVTSYES